MRFSAVSDLKKLVKHYRISLLRGSCIDVGGTEKVNLDGKTELNPLLKIRPKIRFLDKGFNIDTLNTKADYTLDFLNPKSIAHLKSKFNLVFSFDTLEHVSNPLKFCENLILITKPGGYIYLATVFNWPYHPSPEDYYRYSPSGLRELFLNPINNLSKQANVVWSGWGSDPRGVCIIVRKSLPFDQRSSIKALDENWLLKKNKSRCVVAKMAIYLKTKIFANL